jgi:hypothetical protein
MGDITIFGVSALLLIPLIVQAAKALGMPDSFAPRLALILSGVAAGIAQVLIVWPGSELFLRPLFAAIVLYLTVTGLYTTAKNSLTHVGLVKKDGDTE